MKVCMLTSIFPRFQGDHCGAGRTVYEMSKNLKHLHNIEMSVVAPNYQGIPKYENMDGIDVYRFSYFWPHRFQKLAYEAGIPANLRNFYLSKDSGAIIYYEFFSASFRSCAKSRYYSHTVDPEWYYWITSWEIIQKTNRSQCTASCLLKNMDAKNLSNILLNTLIMYYLIVPILKMRY